MDPTTQHDPTTSDLQARSAKKSRRRGVRFRLLDLMWLTTLVAAWLPYFFATRQFKSLQAENASLRRMAEIMVVDDPSEIHVLKVRSHRFGADVWNVFVPESSNYELRFSSEQVSSLGFPSEFERFPLTSGQHRISLMHQRSTQGHSFQLFVDRKPVIVQEQPAEWIDYRSASSVSTGNELVHFDVGKPVMLKRAWFEETLPGFPNGFGHDREELSHKGVFAWLAPAQSAHPPLPRFVTPKNQGFGSREWGFRDGIRIRFSRFFSPSNRSVTGAIQIVHTGVRLPKDVPLNQLAIKPSVDGQSGYANSTTEPGSNPNGNPGLAFATGDSKLAPDHSWQTSPGVISEDGTTLRMFVHPDAFSNGARPIIEVRFDAQYPDRVGFRVHPRAGSAKMSECLLSTLDGSFALLRRIHFGDGQVKTTKQLFPQWAADSQSPATQTSPWQTFSGEQFPIVGGEPLRRAKLTSDISDYSKVKYAAAVPRRWRYEGLAARQSWLFPAEAPVAVALRARRSERNGNGLIPGGPAFGEFEVRAPLQTPAWLWYEIVPLPK